MERSISNGQITFFIETIEPIRKITNIDPKNKEPLSPIKTFAGDQLKNKKPIFIQDKIQRDIANVISPDRNI